jgi:hypothetical protein
LGSAWKILPVTVRSLWSVFEGGGKESPVKHEAKGGDERERTGGGGPRAGKDQRVHYAPGSH